ncbi:MAG: flagellar assembly protein T N-terminal domain-containing protein, partial [Psychrosphaera sp.]|nr:flagellar assembly protein T N-terminal domain-containing protein [Psychrosphaera sp.]
MGLLIMSMSSLASAVVTPMEQVIKLLDNQGGSRTGRTDKEGYYIVVVAFASHGDEYQAYELARLDALKQLNDYVNGTVISGYAQSSLSYDSESEGVKQSFSEVVVNQFKGAVSGARVLKKGQYDGEHFVAMVLAQNDVKQTVALKSPEDSSVFAGRATATVKSVTAKGLASMKNGSAQARKQAIENAIRNAVQQAKGVMVSGRAGMFNGMLSTALSTKTQGYVQSYDIIDESKRRGDYAVIIKALVDTGQLLRDVDFYLAAFNSPR